MKVNNKKTLLSFFLILITLMLTGCTNQGYDITILPDDRVMFSETITTDVDVINKINEKELKFGEIYKQNKDSVDEIDRVHPLFQETAWSFINKGFVIEAIEDTTQVGFRANKEYPNIDEFNKELKDLYKSNLSRLKVQAEHIEKMTGDTYVVSGELEFLRDPDFKVTEKEEKDLKDLVGNVRPNAYLTVKTPGDLKEHSGEVEEGKVKITNFEEQGKPTLVNVVSGMQDDKAKIMLYAGILVAASIVLILVMKNFRKIKFIIFRK